MRWRRISLKLLHPSLQRSNGNAADAIFTVRAVSSRTSQSSESVQKYISPSSAATHLLHAGLCQHWSLCTRIHWAPFFSFLANSSNGAWNGVQSEAVIGGFVPWEKRPVLLAARWATDVFGALRSQRGPLWWRWSALLDSSPVKVHEDY